MPSAWWWLRWLTVDFKLDEDGREGIKGATEFECMVESVGHWWSWWSSACCHGDSQWSKRERRELLV